MANWKQDQLDKINASDELDISSLKADGTLRRPVTVWVVRVGDELFVRSVDGRESAWFRGTQVRFAGRISAGGVEQDVTYEEVTDEGLNEKIDEAYRRKYGGYAEDIVGSILEAEARSATLKLIPLRP